MPENVKICVKFLTKRMNFTKLNDLNIGEIHVATWVSACSMKDKKLLQTHTCTAHEMYYIIQKRSGGNVPV